MTHARPLTLDDFAYDLPEDRIAQEPLAVRDASRLLVRHADGRLVDGAVRALAESLPAGAVVVMNDSRVIPGRLLGHLPSGGKVEVFLLAPLPDPAGRAAWQCLARPMKKLKEGLAVQFPGGLTGTVLGVDGAGSAQPTLRMAFAATPPAFEEWLHAHGYIPLPPYIARPDPQPYATSRDRDRYQTIYADAPGSVAAPTAGLHVSDAILADLAAKGITVGRVTLHVGGGTFLPVKTQDLDAHVMHRETYMVPTATRDAIVAARAGGRPVVAIGTTTFRCLESFWRDAESDPAGTKTDAWRSTDIFIYPRHAGEKVRPRCIDALMTNFHQPGSTLIMLVSALVGYDETMAAYRHALAENYRFLSYGDACLFWL